MSHSLQWFWTVVPHLHMCGSMNTHNHIPYYKQHVQTRAMPAGSLKEVWHWLWTALQATIVWDKQKGGGWENNASEEEQGERLGSLVRCGEVVLGQLEKGEAPRRKGNTQLNLIHFRAVNLHFPRGTLGLCNLGNSLFAGLSTESPEHQIVVKADQDIQLLTTTFPDSEFNPHRVIMNCYFKMMFIIPNYTQDLKEHALIQSHETEGRNTNGIAGFWFFFTEWTLEMDYFFRPTPYSWKVKAKPTAIV